MIPNEYQKSNLRVLVTDVSFDKCKIRGGREWIRFGDLSRVGDYAVISFQKRFYKSHIDPLRGTGDDCRFPSTCHF